MFETISLVMTALGAVVGFFIPLIVAFKDNPDIIEKEPLSLTGIASICSLGGAIAGGMFWVLILPTVLLWLISFLVIICIGPMLKKMIKLYNKIERELS